MKKAIRYLLCVAMLFVLCGCGKSTSPDFEKIKADLSDSLSTHMNYDLKIENVSIKKSITDEKSYSATATVMATTKYAQAEFEADFSYSYYDQGWSINSCTWNIITYQVINYPNEEKVSQLKDAQGMGSLIPLSIEAPSGHGNEFFTSKDEASLNWSTMISAKTTVYTTWMYDINTDDWFIYSQETDDYSYSLANTLDGQYQL